MYDAGLYRPVEQPNVTFLERVFSALNQKYPDGYHGRSLSISDVVELYHDTERKYYYCDTVGYAATAFSPMLAKPMKSS